MNSLVRVFSNFKEFYSEINGATLSGAIDVIVVEQPDGEYLCSPFHVRFGKIGVLRSREKVVDIEINGEPVDIHMKLGDSGEAFFVEECPEEEIEQLPDNLATSPIATTEFDKYEKRQTCNNYDDVEFNSMPIPRRNSIEIFNVDDESKENKFENQISDFTFRRHTDNTLDKKNLMNAKKEYMTQKIRQEWAEHRDAIFDLRPQQVDNDEEIKSTENNNDTVDDLKLKKKRKKKQQLNMKNIVNLENSSSSSSANSLIQEQDQKQASDGAVSNEGGRGSSVSLKNDHKVQTSGHNRNHQPLTNLRDTLFFSDSELNSLNTDCSNSATLIQSDSELEINTREKVITKNPMINDSASWKWGELPQKDQQQQNNIQQVQQRNSMLSGMFSFMKKTNQIRKNTAPEGGIYLSELVANPETAALYFPPNKKEESLNFQFDEDKESGNGTSIPQSPISTELSSKCSEIDDFNDEDNRNDEKILDIVGVSISEEIEEVNETITKKIEKIECHEIKYSENRDSSVVVDSIQETKRSSWWYWRRSSENQYDAKGNEDKTVSSQANNSINNENTETHKKCNNSKEKYKKSLRLSSESIKSLNLKPGLNEIEFSVTTAYQGTTRCRCYLFRWKYNDKIVISDIDGTITRSDVLGHILPMVGKDWAQIGVAQLFSKVEANGYKILYLSARAIGQSRLTREYLRSIRQGDLKLPDGPLLLNPTSLISAFHREVIEKKPEQFKIACLSDIQALFPENPFYAGYGNRINDVWAYRAVGIPIVRIFTINAKGELRHELTQTFQSSYTDQSLEVNEIFPPLSQNAIVDDDEDDDYLQFMEFDDSNEFI